jgi:NitT/TauT family transport system permease protein
MSWFSLAVIVGAWQLASSTGWLNPLFMPSPIQVFKALIALIMSGELLRHLGASLARIGTGWVLGTVAGIILGLSIGLLSVMRSVAQPIVAALFPIPKIALLPLLILWLGIGEMPKIATIALGVFFSTTISTYGGVDSVPRNLIRMAQSFHVPIRMIVWKIVLPGALPAILSGMRISTSLALLLVVSAEMIGADVGLGAFVLSAGNLMQTDQLLAGVLILSALGLSVSIIVGRVERYFLAWR